MEEKALCGICEKQIDSNASTLKAVGLERIIQVSEDIQDGLTDRIHRKTLPIKIYARWRRSYIKPSTITAVKKRKREFNIDRNSDNNVRVNRSQSQLYSPYTDCFFCAETIPTFKNCSKEKPRKL